MEIPFILIALVIGVVVWFIVKKKGTDKHDPRDIGHH